MSEIIPFEPNLDQDRIAELIAEFDGNVTKIAKKLGATSARVRRFIDMSPKLREAVEESFEGLLDEAVDVLIEGLRDQGSFQNRFYSAKALLNSSAARRRGFGQPVGQAALEIKNASGTKTITLKWLEPPDSDGAA